MNLENRILRPFLYIAENINHAISGERFYKYDRHFIIKADLIPKEYYDGRLGKALEVFYRYTDIYGKYAPKINPAQFTEVKYLKEGQTIQFNDGGVLVKVLIKSIDRHDLGKRDYYTLMVEQENGYIKKIIASKEKKVKLITQN